MSKSAGKNLEFNASTVLTMFGVGTAWMAQTAAQPIRFGEPDIYPVSRGHGLLTSADFNSDAREDVAFVGDSEVLIYLNQGDGQLTGATAIPYEMYAFWPRAADMDGDGHVDLVWVESHHDRTNSVAIWFNHGDGLGGDLVYVPLPEWSSTPTDIGDLTGNGFADVLFTTDSKIIHVLANLGNRRFEQREVFTYPLNNYDCRRLAIGDLDRDGDLDIATVYQYSYYGQTGWEIKDTQVVLLANDGSGRFGALSETQLPWQNPDVACESLEVGDLDGDGELDLVLGGTGRLPFRDPCQLLVAQHDGRGGVSVQGMWEVGSGFGIDIRIADLNSSGRLDLLILTAFVRGVYVFANEGDFNFHPVAPFPSGLSGYYMDAADITPDGRIDAIVGGSEGFAVLPNTSPLSGPHLEQSRLVRGRAATFVARQAPPGAAVHFLASLGGQANTVGQALLGGLTLDLQHPLVVLGSATADARGIAVLRRLIPPDAPLIPLTTQAVIRLGPGGQDSVKSRFRTEVIER